MSIRQDILRFAHPEEAPRPGTWATVLQDDFGMPSGIGARCPECGTEFAINLGEGRSKVMMAMVTPPVACPNSECQWVALVSLDQWPHYNATGKPTPYFGMHDPGVGASMIVDDMRKKGDDKQGRYVFPARDVREHQHALMIGDILYRMGWLVNVQTWVSCRHVRLYVTKNPAIHEAASLRLARFAMWRMENPNESIPEWANDDEALVSL